MHSAQARAQAIAAYYQPPATGRPSEIGDASLLQQLLTAIEDGNYIETACHLVGLSPVTYYNWKKRGENGESPFAAFVNAVKEAEARAEAKMLANVRRASELPQFWAAGMTVLERRHPDRWGKRQDDSNQPKVVVNIGVTGTDVRVGVVSPPDFRPPIPEADACKSLGTQAFANPSSLITAVMETNETACQPPAGDSESGIGRANREGVPTPTRQGLGVSRRAVQHKGRSRLGRAGKKKAAVERQDGA